MAPIVTKKLIKKSKTTSSSSTSSTRLRPKSNPKLKRKSQSELRSIWNSTDDWDTLVSDSNLSTSSISTRHPPPTADSIPSLVKYSLDAVVRGFSRIYLTDKDGWESGWESLPDHLKKRIKDGVFRRHAGVLSAEIIKALFILPPDLILNGSLLPLISTTKTLKPLTPTQPISNSLTTLILTHAPQVSDNAFAGLIWNLPNLTHVNLKGCRQAGGRTVDTLIKKCERVEKVNFKGTSVKEDGVRGILDKFGARLKGLKVDSLKTLPFEAFEHGPFPQLTHLCLPGDALFCRGSNKSKDPNWDLCHLLLYFPSLTHLYLPNLTLNQTAHLQIPSNQLVKFSSIHTTSSSPDIPVEPLTRLIESQSLSLKSLHLGTIGLQIRFPDLNEGLLRALFKTKLIDFRVVVLKATNSILSQSQRHTCFILFEVLESWVHYWSGTLKRLRLDIPMPIKGFSFTLKEVQTLDDYALSGITSVPYTNPTSSVLEVLELPNSLTDTLPFTRAIAQGYHALRTLDISGSSITTEELYTIIEACPRLTMIDLTSCRGVPVRHRRNIFKAYNDNLIRQN